MRDITAVARAWIGTPYQHQMSLQGAGCDCIGLVRGIWRDVCGQEPWRLPVYSPDWAEIGGEDRLLAGLAGYFEGVDAARPGDVIAFRMKPNAVAKHVAILSAGDGLDDPRAKIIHAYWGHAVVESWLGPFWRRAVVAVFRFPESKKPLTPTLSPQVGRGGNKEGPTLSPQVGRGGNKGGL